MHVDASDIDGTGSFRPDYLFAPGLILRSIELFIYIQVKVNAYEIKK